MAYIGGQLTEITWNHPTLGSGTLAPKSKENSVINLGGIRNESKPDGIAGDGAAIWDMNMTRWSLEAVVANDTNIGLQQQAMVALAGSTVETNWKITHINGTVWAGSGKPVDMIDADLGNATFKLKIEGSNGLQKII